MNQSSEKVFMCIFCEYSSPLKGSVKKHISSCKFKYTNNRDKSNPNFFRLVDKNDQIYINSIRNKEEVLIQKINKKEDKQMKINEKKENDMKIWHFIQTKIKRGIVDGKISKNQVFDEYTKMFPLSQLNEKEFVDFMKQYIGYRSDKLFEGNKGFFTNIQLIDIV
jgi:hypothetical protein